MLAAKMLIYIKFLDVKEIRHKYWVKVTSLNKTQKNCECISNINTARIKYQNWREIKKYKNGIVFI